MHVQWCMMRRPNELNQKFNKFLNSWLDHSDAWVTVLFRSFPRNSTTASKHFLEIRNSRVESEGLAVLCIISYTVETFVNPQDHQVEELLKEIWRILLKRGKRQSIDKWYKTSSLKVESTSLVMLANGCEATFLVPGLNQGLHLLIQWTSHKDKVNAIMCQLV